MNRNKKQKKPNQKPNPIPPKSKPVPNNTNGGSNNEFATENKTEETNKIADEKGEKRWKEKIIEEMKTGQFWINAFLLIFTAFTFYTTKQQTTAEERANNISEQQFEKENSPFVQIGGFELKDSGITFGRHIDIFYKIKNYGKSPVVMDELALEATPAEFNTSLTMLDTLLPKNITHDKIPISNEGTLNNMSPAELFLERKLFEEMTIGRFYIFFFGHIKYTNTLTGKKYLYKFAFRFSYFLSKRNFVETLENNTKLVE